MFSNMKSEKDFIHWTHEKERQLEVYPRENFIISFITFERYLYRCALAIEIGGGLINVEARKRLKKTPDFKGINALIKFCSNPKYGGNKLLIETIEFKKLDLGFLNNMRNQIIHGVDLKSKKIAADSAKSLWDLLRLIAGLRFSLSPRKEFYPWQRLPVKRKKA